MVHIAYNGLSAFVDSYPKLSDDPSNEELIDDEEQDTVVRPELEKRSAAIIRKYETDPIETIQLVHQTSFAKVKRNRNYYSIVVSLDGVAPEALANVDRVVYFLHKTFKNPVREVRDATNNFRLKTAAWGEFTIRAAVYLKNNKNPVCLSRYLNIER